MNGILPWIIAGVALLSFTLGFVIDEWINRRSRAAERERARKDLEFWRGRCNHLREEIATCIRRAMGRADP